MGSCSPVVVMSEPVDASVVDEVVSVLGRVFSVECPGYVEVHFHAAGPVMGEDVMVEYETGVYHEAFDDYPRIHVVVADYAVWPRSLRQAMLVHEAGHAVLHGRREFYMGVGRDLRVLHAALTTVKDLEVHLWMAKRGFRGDLEVLREYWDARVEEGCGLLEEVMDEARRLTIYVALGLSPVYKCGRISEKLYAVLREVAGCEPRPWACRAKLLEFFEVVS